ncbi:acyl-CoA dehydrogenase [Leptospira bourretii]|uniref:acyl-CoA dehydrogenase family protein n=1 Tax=Leptospira bourretii TaxID=2484962 RepID=UPI0010913587|nr:acyl-CoA dehydrogenase family protein [Leptospira bourretii]TGL23274.1 acyl-CoA dehydrogenase [Leptospira bourretii]
MIHPKLNPYLNEEERSFYNTVFQFSEDKVFPSAEERDEKEIWSDELWKEFSKAGLTGLTIPSDFGGEGASCLQCSIATDAFASGSLDGGMGLSWVAHLVIGTMPIIFQGTNEQKSKYLPKLASGEWMAGFALTEPASGSDAASLLTKAEEVEGGWKLNGTKMYITNGPVGQVFVVMARTSEKGRGPMGISAFIVESHTPGFKVSKVLKKLGHHTSMTAELVFEDMIIPKENLLGPINTGFMRIGKETLEWERTVFVAGLAGAMEFCFRKGLRYANERVQFGKPISSFYGMRDILVRNWVYIQAARRLIYWVAERKDRGVASPLESSLGKLISSEIAEDVAKDSVQLFGGYGYMKEYSVERFYRDVKLGTIGGGTSEIQRSIISSLYPGKEKFLKDFSKLEIESSLADKIQNVLFEIILSMDGEPNRKKQQSVEFAFADVLSIFVILSLSEIDTHKSTEYYSRDEKLMDRKLLSYYLVGKYLMSFTRLSHYVPEKLTQLWDSYSQLGKSIEETVHERFHSLQELL